MPDEPDRPAPRPLRHLAEGLTIMFGILAALLVDAAWDYSADRAAERQYLAGLRTEFEAALAEIQSDQDRRGEMLSAANRLLEARSGGAPPSVEVVSALLTAVIDYRFYTPSHPVLEEVLGAGALRILRSDELRFRLRVYAQERDRLEVVETKDLRLLDELVTPYLSEQVALDLLSAPARMSATQRAAVAGLVNQDRFGSLIYLRWSELDTSQRFAGGVIRNINGVLEALDSGG